MANKRKVPGQLLIIPKRHIEHVSELTSEESKELFDAIIDAEKRIVERYHAGCGIMQHYKPYMEEDGFKVDHLHFHVMPRRKGDDLDRMRDNERILYADINDREIADAINIFQ